MAARRAVSQLPACSVHLRITPRPANLSESREILRVLQGFGDISTYKHLRYEYHNPAANIAVAIYRSPSGAQQALNASPIRFALERVVPAEDDALLDDEDAAEVASAVLAHPQEGKDAQDNLDDILRPSSLLNRTVITSATHPAAPAPSASAAMPFAPPAPQPTTQKWFQVTVDRSRLVHQDFVERQPLWAKFTPMKSMAQEDLAKVVPHVGLSDVSKRPPNAHRTPNWVLKRMSAEVETGMPSLKAMWEEAHGGRV